MHTVITVFVRSRGDYRSMMIDEPSPLEQHTSARRRMLYNRAVLYFIVSSILYHTTMSVIVPICVFSTVRILALCTIHRTSEEVKPTVT